MLTKLTLTIALALWLASFYGAAKHLKRKDVTVQIVTSKGVFTR